MKKEIRLSQCMIVKNEEKNIERALSWGKSFMWEQIVVDTGSTDRTVEIARRLGAKVYHFEWIDDFAAAKNYAVSQAQGDWIVFLDADEYFLEEDAKRLVPLLEKLEGTKYNALVTRWVQVEGSEELSSGGPQGNTQWVSAFRADGSTGTLFSSTQTRIFRNQPGLRYRGRVHEKLYVEHGKLWESDAGGELSILHTGYSEAEMKEKDKAGRNIALIKKELESNPKDHVMLSCLGDSYSQQGNKEEAARWYEQAVSCMPKRPDENDALCSGIFRNLMAIYVMRQDVSAVQKVYETAVKRFPKEPDYDYILGGKCISLGLYKEGAEHLQRALTLLDLYGSENKAIMLTHNLMRVWELLAVCHFESGDLEQCVNCAVAVLRVDPWRMGTLQELLLAFKTDEERARAAGTPGKAASPAQVQAFLGSLYDLRQPEAAEFVKKAAEGASYAGLVRLL